MLRSDGHGGFTIIELLIGITLLGVLLALGVPALGTYLQNSKVSSAASSLYSAMQLARTEAIRRNVRVEFVMTDTAVSTADLANTLTPAINGRNWVVRAASGPASFVRLDAKAGLEGDGGGGASPAIRVAGSASAPAVFDGRIAFNGFGAAVDPAGVPATYFLAVDNPVAGACAAASGPGGPIRCRRIVVSAGGQIAVCDPVAPTGDSRAC